MQISIKIKKCREEKGLSQAEFAKIAKLNITMVSKYETSVITPTVENLKKISKALDVSIDYLLLDDVPKTGKTELKDLDLLEKFRLVEKMDKEDQAAIRRLIESMIVKNKLDEINQYRKI